MSFSLLLKFLIAGAVAAAVVSLGDERLDSKSPTRTSIISSGSGSNSRSLGETIHPDLSFGDINIMVVSDVHSFVGGHPHEVDRNADYGDLFSFHERLKAHCEQKKEEISDLWLFNNGDFLHGTGLAIDGNSTNLLPIVNAIPWDALAMGRQEATYSDVLRDMSESLLPNYPGKYITSNVVWSNTGEPYGVQYQLLKGRNSTILVFGFLYDTVTTSEMIEVLPIKDTVEQDWFRSVLRYENNNATEKYDAIVVMAQMDIDSPFIDTLYQEIRTNVDPQMPIQFIAGHSHKRAKKTFKNDNFAHKMEPGGLFDTIGWMTIPKFDNVKGFPARGKGLEIQEVFQQEFLNTSKTVLHSRLNLKENQELRTEQGTAISEMIRDVQLKLGLNQIVACPGHDYFRNISIHNERSLWKLWREHVVRTEIFNKDEDRVMLVSKSNFRYDLRGSGKHDAMTLDDVVAIAPYMDRVVYVGDVPDWMIRRMNNTFNTFSHHNIIPDYVLAGDLDDIKTAESYQLYTHEVDVPKIRTKLEKFEFNDFKMEYTGQRDTLYWLNYVQTAFPCEGKKTAEPFKVPYFYDPANLEEESTDGTLTIETDSGDEEGSALGENSDEETWTLPPNGGYQGYIPGKGLSKEIPSDAYIDYKSKEEREEEAFKAKAAAAARIKGTGGKDLQSQLRERKKTRKKIIKGFALTFASFLLLIPVVCLVMQIMGRNDYYDDYNDGGGAGIYDREEMKMLQRHRRNGTLPTKRGASLNSAPFREIEMPGWSDEL